MSLTRWKGVMIHHTAGHDGPGADLQAVRRYHVSTLGWQDVGYHVFCERVGGEYEVLLARRLTAQGAHCPGKNADHIGFCFAGNFSTAPPPDEQLFAGAKHIAALMKLLQIPLSGLVPHRDHRATECPGKLFPWDRFREMVKNL